MHKDGHPRPQKKLRKITTTLAVGVKRGGTIVVTNARGKKTPMTVQKVYASKR
jgi:hypothetical protein